MYVKDGVVYKVQFAVHGSGNLYAKRLVVAGECQGHLDTSGNSIEMVYCDGSGDLTARYRTYEDALVAAQKWIDAR